MRAVLALLACGVGVAVGQFGRRTMPGEAGGSPDVDLAMEGWAQLAQQPEKMQELFQSMQKDPEIMAKAQEMLKDPQYMAAAKAKVAELEAKAKARGLLNEKGMPTGASPLEEDNLAKYKAGLMNDAELGLANLQNAMKDPSMIAQTMQMLKDPDTMEEVKKMMNDPAFKAQAQQMMNKLKQNGGLDAMSGFMGQAAQAMGGMGGMGGDPELERLRLENERLRARLNRDEL